jgi:hypothetical protein
MNTRRPAVDEGIAKNGIATDSSVIVAILPMWVDDILRSSYDSYEQYEHLLG